MESRESERSVKLSSIERERKRERDGYLGEKSKKRLRLA